MCTVVILRRPKAAWPVIFAGNRDEMADRPWRPPGRHWPERPDVVAGLDELSGGSWLGVNDHGVLAVVLNRHGSLGPAPGKRSRGELVLEALDHAEAGAAARALADLQPESYRSFNLVVADARQAFWIRHAGGEHAPAAPPRQVEVRAVPEGLSMLSACDLNDARSPRIRRFLDDFRAAPPPDPEAGDWSAWQGLLARRDHDAGAGGTGAMTFDTDAGFATVSSALIALPAPPRRRDEEAHRPAFLFAPGPPDRTAHAPVAA